MILFFERSNEYNFDLTSFIVEWRILFINMALDLSFLKKKNCLFSLVSFTSLFLSLSLSLSIFSCLSLFVTVDPARSDYLSIYQSDYLYQYISLFIYLSRLMSVSNWLSILLLLFFLSKYHISFYVSTKIYWTNVISRLCFKMISDHFLITRCIYVCMYVCVCV